MRLVLWTVIVVVAWTSAFFVNASALDTDLLFTHDAYVQKKSIVEGLPSSRVLFFGGSHTYFSVNAALHQELSGCPSVNFGLHAGLGLGPVLALAAETWRPGDLVVLFPEYGLLEGDGTGWLTAAFGASIGRPGFGADGVEQAAQLTWRSGTTSVQSLAKSAAVGLFGMAGRTEVKLGNRGDTEFFITSTRAVPGASGPRLGEKMRERLERFAASASFSGVRLVIGLSWLLVREDAIGRLREETAKLADDLEAIGPVIRYGQSYNLQTDPALFSDTDQHASPIGRDVHTRLLTSELSAYLPANCTRTAGN
jgi:hypothetical protein